MLLMLCAPAMAAADPAVLDVAMPPAAAQRQVLAAVRDIPPQREEHRRYRMALPFGAPLFPPDDDFVATGASAIPNLAAWTALPPAQRRFDVLIVPDADYFWNAEGRLFNCQFLIHIEARPPAGARLFLSQVHPTVYAGKRFHILGRTGPGRYLNIRAAGPSAQAAAELHAFLASALARQK
jgi:hypothetical protein